MKGFTKKLLLVLSMFLLILPIFSTTVEATTTTVSQQPEMNATAGMIFDENSGQVIYKQNADKKVAIGSITKIITLYLVTKAIREGKFTEEDKLTPTAQEAEMTQDSALTNVRLDADKQYSVKDLYNAAWIVSSNSAAMVLADEVAGSQAKFVKMMRQTLKDWGIKNAQLYNVSGLNNSDLKKGMYVGPKDGENKLSADDIGVVVKHVLDKYPEILKTTSQSKLSFPVDNEIKVYDSLNLLLKGGRDYQSGYEFDGLKTGTTEAAGDSFVGTLPLDNTRIVTIVLDAKGEKTDKDKRFRSTQKLVHYLKDNYEYKKVLDKGQNVKINNKKYKVYDSIYFWLPKKFNVAQLSYTRSSDDLGFAAKHKKQTVKLIVANTSGGYLPFKKADVKKVIHKKTNQKSWWDQIVEFFNHLF
ncbi:D-alanyl-D-alanine carboxypeptidase family protein [Companilactobacillus halodurans]|uniref:D-alanyl-D-alanine carboxypeptidase n=1 Tax=Companilactobacillus halodurans TaxID=2584183 RepID=A0A5P0ZQY3_9LACO|nr:D-alanyl-D-alanine carboxypeptidase family protein [Companilactobacillus halodurans]MQS76674.1 D-alanyl-D-alanine carboxypeptidase [Companilactobacillus halodurans]MQS97827.1 D-alanyl-D-alanine carboxypeptidase [Companilactobacillus halodurans]